MLDLTKNPGRPLIVAFLLGAVWAVSGLIWMQDWMGRQAYVDYLSAHWVDMPWQFSAVTFVASLWGLFRLSERVFNKHSEEAVEFALSQLPDTQPGQRRRSKS